MSYATYRDRGEVTDIAFRTLSGKRANEAVEEMALLAAAERARQLGRQGFIIVKRRDIFHTTSIVSYGSAGPPLDNGVETVLTVAFHDLSALPDGRKESAWRFFDAAEVEAALSPYYGKPVVHPVK